MIRITLQGTGGPLALSNPAWAGPHCRLETDPSRMTGVVRPGEQDVPPRVTRVQLASRHPDWHRLQSPPALVAGVDSGGCLVIDSDPPGRMLADDYWLGLEIDDVKIEDARRIPVRVPNTGSRVEVERTAEFRRIDVWRWEQVDAQIRQASARSQIDGSSVRDWLASDVPQARRQACLLNVLGSLRARRLDGAYDANGRSVSLVTKVVELQQVYVDRVVALVDPSLRHALDGARRDFVKPDDRIHSSHEESLRRYAGHHGWTWPPQDKVRGLHGYRFTGKPSMHIVLAIRSRDLPALAEIDIDRASPKDGLFSALTHVLELFDDGIDHIELYRDKLAEKPDARFIAFRPA